MNAECFIDTNVLLYAATADAAERKKQDAAYDLIAADNFGISTQVLQEFFHNATKKVRKKMRPDKALDWLGEILHRPCVIVDVPLFRHATEISVRYKITYWDGAILAATHALGAKVLYSEDLNHGQTYGTVRVENPFRGL